MQKMVRCELNGADYGPPFTDGKLYEATHYKNVLWSVRDDLGYERYIIPGELCPHLQKSSMYEGYSRSEPVGRFVEVKDGITCTE